jgi:universal stress protein A
MNGRPIFKKILVPMDFSEGSRHALHRAAELAAPDSEVLLLHVVEPVIIPSIFAEQAMVAMDSSAWTAKAEKVLAGLAAELRAGGTRVRTLINSGHAAAEIVATALAEDIDLIVIGSSGHRSATYAIFGSTVERVTRKAPCPALVTRPKTARVPVNDVARVQP